jgi:hypothetical protein
MGTERGLAAHALIILVLLGVVLALFIATMSPVDHDNPEYASDRLRSTCLVNLAWLGSRFAELRDDGRLKTLKVEPGAAFLIQIARTDPEGLRALVCPGDPEAPKTVDWNSPHCSYRGPDLETARRLVMERGTIVEPIIIACDANGPDGDDPFHPKGVLTLWSDGRIRFIRWEKMAGFEGSPVVVGPGSPDERFRHLVWLALRGSD